MHRAGRRGLGPRQLVEPAIEDEPGPGGPDVVRLLEEAADIVDAVVPETLADVEREERKHKGRPARAGVTTVALARG